MKVNSLPALAVAATTSLFLMGMGDKVQGQDKGIVLVAGGSGGTGAQLMNQLTEAGFKPRGLTRDAEGARNKIPGDFDWAEADARDIASLRPAFEGADFLIGGLPPPIGVAGDQLDFSVTKNLNDLAAEYGIKRYILITSLPSNNEDPDHWLSQNPDGLLAWRERGEEYLKESGVDYTIIRAGNLGPAYEPGSRGLKIAQGDDFTGQIHRADLAAVCVAVLEALAANRTTFALASDETAVADAWRNELSDLVAD